MIPVKNEREIEVMRKACRITAAARALAGEMVRPGVTTRQIDKAVHDYIVSQGAKPTFLGYGGFPASVCISVNEVVIHGIPGHRVLQEGDIVSIDVGAQWGGFTGDCAGTFACGKISAQAQKLITASNLHVRDTGSPTSAMPFRHTWKARALALSARLSAMVWASICTKNRKSPILVPPAEAREWSKA